MTPLEKARAAAADLVRDLDRGDVDCAFNRACDLVVALWDMVRSQRLRIAGLRVVTLAAARGEEG